MGVSEQLRTILSITLVRPHLQWGVDLSSLSNFIPHVSCQMGLITRFTHYVLLILNGLSLSHTLGTSRQLGFQLNQVTSIPLISITLFEIFIFRPKIQLWFPEKIVNFSGWKTRENVAVLDFLAVDNFDFTRKIVKKILGEKLVKMLGFCQNWIFGQKIWLFE